jgi:hypothetical protein
MITSILSAQDGITVHVSTTQTTTKDVKMSKSERDMAMEQYIEEIRLRGGETEIVGKYGVERLAIVSQRDGLVLLRAEGWRKYGTRHPARIAALAYLAGEDDAGPWAVRVAGTCTTVGHALDFIEPADVKAARAAGRRVLRQGDVYAVETTRDAADATAQALPRSHEWRPCTRYLVHRPTDGRRHRPLRCAFPVKFVQQRAYEMGRTGRRGSAD